jgi:predicted alpha/beta hydrolase family esterase
MKNAILVPGRPDKDEHYDAKLPSNSESHWFSWLKRQLILRDIHAVSIEPPYPFRPRYEEWKREFERFEITPETILVGHSCGGGFLVRYLSEHKDLTVGRVALVAPWTNPDNFEVSDTADFFEFISADDEPSVVKTVEILKTTVQGLELKEYTDKGHFCFNDLGTVEFPELLAAIL